MYIKIMQDKSSVRHNKKGGPQRRWSFLVVRKSVWLLCVGLLIVRLPAIAFAFALELSLPSDTGRRIPQHEKNTDALIKAAETGNTAEVVRLLVLGTAVNARDLQGWTPLMMASRGNYPEIVQFLLASGADTNRQNKGGATALMLAANNARTHIAATLLAHGARVNVKNNQGWTALMYAVWKGDRTMVQLLVNSGTNVLLQDKLGWTPLQYAMWQHETLLHSSPQEGRDRESGRLRQNETVGENRELLDNYEKIIKLLTTAESLTRQVQTLLL